MPAPRPITPREFFDALADADIIRKGERIRSVTIRADFSEPLVTIEVERSGDVRLLAVAGVLTGVEVTDAADAR